MRADGICWCSPLPPTRSGVADYAVELLPELSRLMRVVVRRPPGWVEAGASWARGLTFLNSDEPTPDGLTPLYHLGNNPYHLWVVARLRQHRGVVVLHDTVLHHLLVEEAADDGDWTRFASELEGAHPGLGAQVATARQWGYAGRTDPFLLPARRAYLHFARGVVVHSERAVGEVRRDCPELPVVRVPLAVAALPPGDRDAWRGRLGVCGDELLAVHLGFLTPAKGMGMILRALLGARELGIGVRLVVVGEGSEAASFRDAVRRSGLGDRVTEWGFASPEDLGGIVAAADVGLVPRFPTAGETSAAALRFLASGTPVVVSAFRQFIELPEAAALRVPPGERGVADAIRHLTRLALDEGARQEGRRAARDAWQQGGHDPARAAASMAAALTEVLA
jgi:glycosyltransferase involved in cell wall biosynthesis